MNRFGTTFLASLLAVGLLYGPLNASAQEVPGVDNSGRENQGPAPSDVNSKRELPESPGAAQNTDQQVSPSRVNVTQQPSGAAAAPAPKVSGNPVSRPAGSAIAPPKQRQVRSFLIKVGLIAGAGVALGTVAALSLGSSSRPPGSR